MSWVVGDLINSDAVGGDVVEDLVGGLAQKNGFGSGGYAGIGCDTRFAMPHRFLVQALDAVTIRNDH